MTKTKIPFLSPDQIDQVAYSVLSKYRVGYGPYLPINPEKLLETEYNMQIIPIPGLNQIGGTIDCSLSSDGMTVFVDQRQYNDDVLAKRLSFDFAHELGHKVLHSEQIKIATTLTADEYGWVEKQANMFAARFLMPEQIVLGVIASEIVDRLDGIANSGLTLEACVEWRTPNLASYFGVSTYAMTNRIKNIDLQQLLNGPYISTQDRQLLTTHSAIVEKSGDNIWSMRRALYSE